VAPVDGPFDLEEFERWRREAERALAAAEAQAAVGIHNWACFAAEQAAQLAVKALLHGFGAGAWGHDLQRLGSQLVDLGLEVPQAVIDSMLRLGRHYIPARYPDAHPSGPAGDHYGVADWEMSRADARTVLGFIDDVAAG
jgi:HEPN domain-containing protein